MQDFNRLGGTGKSGSELRVNPASVPVVVLLGQEMWPMQRVHRSIMCSKVGGGSER